jgi:hypothetical protein
LPLGNISAFGTGLVLVSLGERFELFKNMTAFGAGKFVKRHFEIPFLDSRLDEPLVLQMHKRARVLQHASPAWSVSYLYYGEIDEP